ncbi:hypothetical protein EYC84_010152 [Monilinia fructicola]|uniref:Uncharacterized protein n=1 Tax=Monilinia fructicola TaxID=38448 RepID=A0A5M9JGI1_MONFR|nr:hypothetical protein EYC84_010152 [Monilinia fructicola]
MISSIFFPKRKERVWDHGVQYWLEIDTNHPRNLLEIIFVANLKILIFFTESQTGVNAEHSQHHRIHRILNTISKLHT